MTKEEFVAGYCERSGVTWVQEMEMRKRMGQYDEMADSG